MIGVISLTSINVFAQSNSNVPEWVKNNAGWWAEGTIDDESFIQGIQFLIKDGIMEIPPTAQGTSSNNKIPSWIKNNAGWWAEDILDDDSFIQGIKWLISSGIINIKNNFVQENNSLNSILIQDYDLREIITSDDQRYITTQNWSSNLYDAKEKKLLQDYDHQKYLVERHITDHNLWDYDSCEWGIILSYSKYADEEKETCFKLGDYNEVFVKISKFTDSTNAKKMIDATPSEIKFVYKKYEKFSRNTSCIWQFENFNESYDFSIEKNNYLASHPELLPEDSLSPPFVEEERFGDYPINEQVTNRDMVMCQYKNYVLTLISDSLWRENQFMLMDKMIEKLLLLEGGTPTFTTSELLDKKDMIKYEMSIHSMIDVMILSCTDEYPAKQVKVILLVSNFNFEEKNRKLSGVITLKANNYLDQVMASNTVNFKDLPYMEQQILEKNLNVMTSVDYCSYDIASIR